MYNCVQKEWAVSWWLQTLSFYDRFTRVNSMRWKAMQCGDVCFDYSLIVIGLQGSPRYEVVQQSGKVSAFGIRGCKFVSRQFFLFLFLIFNGKCSWQFVKKFAYASFANLLLPIIHGLLLGMTWPVNENNSLFTSSKHRKISNINKQNICKKYINNGKNGLWKGLVFRPQTSCINNCPHSIKFKNDPYA